VSRSAKEIALMRAIRTAMDPRGILNPGKIL
jgi:FAD/FMN-containing dehydrogenase